MSDDLVIVGGGPAGLTAGMYASRGRLKVRLVEAALSGGQINETSLVENYPGVDPISGGELAQRMEKQAVGFGLSIETAVVRNVAKASEGFSIALEGGKELPTRAVVVAVGAAPVKLGIPGEDRLTGRGVSYCAVCDGPFYDNREIAVVGGGDSAVEEAVYLTRFASKVHLIHRRDELRATKDIQERAFAEEKIQFHWSCTPEEILGEHGVDAIRIKSVKTGEQINLPVYGVFFYVGMKPNLLTGLEDMVEQDDRGFIVTDMNMACKEPGLFAAGDIRSKPLRQIATAVGDGALAAYSAQHFLEEGR